MLISYLNRKNHAPSHVGLPTELEDIWLLLDQRSKVDFEWTLYKDSTIHAVIPEEFFMNPNAWHAKVPLDSDYMSWFIWEKVRRRQPLTSRTRQAPLNERGGWTVDHLSLMWYMPEPSHFPMMATPTTMPYMHEAPKKSAVVIPSAYRTQHSYAHSPWVMQTPPRSLFYQCGSSFQPPIYKLEDT
ncbi:hypothetical protein Gogos_011650 [Gossypium gossypioides]|uniref:Uncharacterized protein n=1 Tax=Gossypium gossypioides TaxID=34282 RepID=A0A7J9BQ09_GOSGO|nr:hypothetical protein [Gossypium gossypioides]